MNPADFYDGDKGEYWREFLDTAMAEFGYSNVTQFDQEQMRSIREVFEVEYANDPEGANDLRRALQNQTEPDPEPDPMVPEPQAPVSSTDLTKVQSQRFDNLVPRIAKKIQQTFGGTAESFDIGIRNDAIIPGQAIQKIEIESRGVIYTITIQAEKC
jgi:hypothetical protein